MATFKTSQLGHHRNAQILTSSLLCHERRREERAFGFRKWKTQWALCIKFALRSNNIDVVGFRSHLLKHYRSIAASNASLPISDVLLSSFRPPRVELMAKIGATFNLGTQMHVTVVIKGQS